MARSLHEARRQAAQALDEQVSRISDEIAETHPEWVTFVAVADGRQLRGIPAVGPHSLGSAIPGSMPGESLGLFQDDE